MTKPNLAEEIRSLGTEQQNPASERLDSLSALEIARLINAEDASVPRAVERALPQVAQAIDAIAAAFAQGGRLIYVGCGTSGRIAALDSSEIPPTFSTAASTVQYVMAGGDRALGHAAEFNEDSRKQGQADLAKRKPGKKDVVVGLAASGRTPYTVAAIEYARRKGAATVAVVCNRGSELGRAAHIEIVAEVGPEVLSGSTRMKAGTAQKLILNMLTTGAMARNGRVYGNLMVYVRLKNKKLVERGVGILMKAVEASREDAVKALKASRNQVPVALVMLKAGVSAREAAARLKKVGGKVRRAAEG